MTMGSYNRLPPGIIKSYLENLGPLKLENP